MTTQNMHFEGQTNGTGVTIANSTTYGDSPASLVEVSNGTVNYSTDTSLHGTRSAALAMTSGATACLLDIGLGGMNSATVAARAYMKLTSAPSSASRIMQLRSTGSKELGGFNFNANGTVAVVDLSGVAVSTSSATTQVISPTAWYRFEYVWKISATAGSYKAAVYVGDSTSAWFSYTSATNLNTGTANIGEVRFGKASNSGTLAGAWYLDDIAVDDAGTSFIGPYVPGGPTVATAITPGYAKLDATGSRAIGSGALSYSLSPSTGVVQPSTGIFYVPQASTTSVYTLAVTESGGGTTTRNVTIPALTAAASSQTTVMTQRYIANTWQ